MITLRGKSLVATAKDIAEGYVTVNPIFLKPLDSETLKALYQQVSKVHTEVRGEKFPFGNVIAIRARNIKLQRLHNATIVIRNFAKEKGFKDML